MWAAVRSDAVILLLFIHCLLLLLLNVGRCPYWGGDCLVVYTLFVAVPIGCGPLSVLRRRFSCCLYIVCCCSYWMWAAVRTEAVIVLLFIHCLLLLLLDVGRCPF